MDHLRNDQFLLRQMRDLPGTWNKVVADNVQYFEYYMCSIVSALKPPNFLETTEAKLWGSNMKS